MAVVQRWLGDRPATTVLTYLGMPGELGIHEVVGPRHRWLSTRTPARGPLTVHPFDAPREQHRYGFEQPAAGTREVSVSEVGIALVPGLAFDREGRRLGRGKGYYDRLLAGFEGLRVAITLERFLVEALPTDAFDVPMTHLATERGVRRV